MLNTCFKCIQSLSPEYFLGWVYQLTFFLNMYFILCFFANFNGCQIQLILYYWLLKLFLSLCTFEFCSCLQSGCLKHFDFFRLVFAFYCRNLNILYFRANLALLLRKFISKYQTPYILWVFFTLAVQSMNYL